MILCDLDGIVAHFFDGLWNALEARTGYRGNTSLVKSWDFSGIPEEHRENVFKVFHEPGFFENLKPIPGAVETLEYLQKQGHEIHIVSTPCTPHSAAEKIRWVEKYLPFIPYKNLFVCHHKHMIKGDVLIDDSLDNAKKFSMENPYSDIFTIAYPYNDDDGKVYNLRAIDYSTPEAAWKQIKDCLAL